MSGPGQPAAEPWHLRLYIAGPTPRSLLAYDNLKRICSQYLPESEIEVIDLVEEPERARADQIVAIPTLVRHQPQPVRKLIGDLTDTERVLAGLELEWSRGEAE